MSLEDNTFWRLKVIGNNEIDLSLNVNYPIDFTRFNQVWILSTDFHKSPISSLKETHPMAAALLHADRTTDGLTDMTELIGAFSK